MLRSYPATQRWPIHYYRCHFYTWRFWWGVPQKMHSLLVQKLETTSMWQLSQFLDWSERPTKVYYRRGNAAVDGVNPRVKGFLVAFVDCWGTRNWRKALPRGLLAYRTETRSNRADTELYDNILQTARAYHWPQPHPRHHGLLSGD